MKVLIGQTYDMLACQVLFGHCTRSWKVARKSLPALAGIIATSFLPHAYLLEIAAFSIQSFLPYGIIPARTVSVLTLTHCSDHDLLPSIDKCSSAPSLSFGRDTALGLSFITPSRTSSA